MYKPLAGYKILDCSRLLPYQYCTLLLGDLGAEVLKVEEPGRGDYGRWVDSDNPGKERLVFAMANRNKKSLTLNLKEEAGKKIFKELAATYDVLFESFRPGVMDKLGLGYQVIKEINPKIIYCSGTGYGQTGPYRLKAGHDINYISIAGILGITATHTGQPVIPGIPIADMAGGGVFPAFIIVAALIGREKTGLGMYVDVAMTDVATSLNIINIASALSKSTGGKLHTYNIRGKSVCYNTYETKDGKFISIGNLEPKFWKNFCHAIGRDDLIENHYSTFKEGEQTTEILKTIFLSKTQAEWVEFFKEVDNCFAPVLMPEETLEDQHLIARGMITKMPDKKRKETVHIGFPALFLEDLDYKRSPAPVLGEHTIETLKSLGYSPVEIETLKKNGVI
ncbi:MAG: CaiB/BaiF CoA-transferase family protein [Thermodesulfobacteriota bacterium]